jgi:hypothetical protein
MKLRYWLAVLLTLVMMIFVASPASAHRPENGNETGFTDISDPTISYAYYREFEQPGDLHLYRFEGQAGQLFHAGINIPQLPGLEGYQVSLALIGPGLPALDIGVLSTAGEHAGSGPAPQHTEPEGIGHQSEALHLPEEIDLSRLGGLVLPGQDQGQFFEAFTQTRYWTRQALDINLPLEGVYYLVVWNPSGETGKYVLDSGTREVFSASDLFRMPVWWIETRLYFDQGPRLLIYAGLAAALLIGTIGLAIRRRTSTAASRR